MLEFTFEELLYDVDSLKSINNVRNGDGEGDRLPYPGMEDLIAKLRELENSETSILVEVNIISVGDKKYAVRYNSQGALSFGRIGEKNIKTVFAVSKNNNQYQLYVVKDYENVYEKSWNLKQTCESKAKSNDIAEINQQIIKIIKKELNKS